MIQLIRGFKDILPGEVELWQFIEKTATSLLEDFGFREIRIPVMERTELFARSIGDATDIVEKEMYTFADRKGDLITLRPEATASIVRAYIQHRMYASEPVRKFYTVGPMFRRERPQKGRYRQFYQINAEIFGVASPLADVQLMVMLKELFTRLSVPDIQAHVNSLGCPQCRPGYRDSLVAYIDSIETQLCTDCRRRKERNPLRVLDCKVPSCREAMAEAPSIADVLCTDCRKDFDTVLAYLEALDVPYRIDKRLVRGLDYYTRTTFEMQTGALGAQSAVAGGGRYDGLVKMLGGPDIPATGFAVGFDRLAEVCGIPADSLQKAPGLYIAALGKQGQEKAFGWICRLGARGIHAEMDFEGRSLKSQMKRADRMGARFVLLLGDEEIARGFALLRNMTTSQQEELPFSEMVDLLANRIAGPQR
jgi:histidyl-tRNA synthetase